MAANRHNKVAAIVYILVASIILAVFSTISDRIPFQLSGHTPLELAPYVLAGVINNLSFWFLVAAIFGYHFGRSWAQSALAGAAFILLAITLYLIVSTVTAPARAASDGAFFLPVMLTWYIASAAGGAIGGGTGFLAQKYAAAWLVPLVFIIVQVARYGARTWQQPLGAATNIVLLLVAAGIGLQAYRQAS